MDMLDFEGEALYFDEPINSEAKQCLESAADHYGDESVERWLLRAYFLEPAHPMVLVGLYRYFYYQHRLEDALVVAERTLAVIGKRLELPKDWRDLDEKWLGSGVMVSMTLIRFYMLALKGAGFLELRLGNYQSALERLTKVAELDTKDRLGAGALINVAREAIDQRSLALQTS
ncbi:MAG: hypothetical protein ABW162_02310 [Candidatus Sedimenticola sp. PURPLELP]